MTKLSPPLKGVGATPFQFFFKYFFQNNFQFFFKYCLGYFDSFGVGNRILEGNIYLGSYFGPQRNYFDNTHFLKYVLFVTFVHHFCGMLAYLGLKIEFWRSTSTWGLILDPTGTILITNQPFFDFQKTRNLQNKMQTCANVFKYKQKCAKSLNSKQNQKARSGRGLVSVQALLATF